MKASITNFRLLLCLLLIFLFFSQTGIRAQASEMSAQDLTKASTAVLYGKCSGIECGWNANRSIIYTYVTVIPEGYLKGNLGPKAVIAVPGGKLGEIVFEVSDMPVFTNGEEIVAFVRKGKDGKYLVTGGCRGKLKIDTDKSTGKKVVHETLPAGNVSEQGPGHNNCEMVKLEDFIAKVKGYVKSQ
jgi:hypothetical protein